MIPYDELCASLARWRERNGLKVGPPPPVAFISAAPVEDMPGSAVSGEISAPRLFSPPPVHEETPPADDTAEDPTSLHHAAPAATSSAVPDEVEREEITSEIDIEGAEVIDEEDI